MHPRLCDAELIWEFAILGISLNSLVSYTPLTLKSLTVDGYWEEKKVVIRTKSSIGAVGVIQSKCVVHQGVLSTVDRPKLQFLSWNGMNG